MRVTLLLIVPGPVAIGKLGPLGRPRLNDLDPAAVLALIARAV